MRATLAAAVLVLCPSVAVAQTCEGNPIYDRCIAAIGRVGGPMAVVRDIFRTPDGRDARGLTFGRLIAGTVSGYGVTTDPTMYTAYTYTGSTSVMAVAEYVNALDFRWGQSLRSFDDGTFVPDGVGPGMSIPGHDCDRGDNCGYAPWRGKIFDLLGDSNRVAVFPITDHTTDSCLEAFEYSVYLTDDPMSRELAPEGRPDSSRWNRAVMIRAFTEGWTRGGTDPSMPSPRGNYLADSPTLVWALPCGVTFRYVSLVPGNYGSPDVACRFNSGDDELDAVAGLNEDNTAVCPDRDDDGFRDSACGGNDCNDMDRRVNPGAVENCTAARDLNCDGRTPSCPEGLVCVQGLCVGPCVESACGRDFVCVVSDGGGSGYCIPARCAGVSCPDGQVCGPMGCQDPCMGARCPTGQVCRGGACVDPCAGVLCPMRQHCEGGRCLPNCPCVPCPMGSTCFTSGRCERPACASLRCPEGQLPDCTGELPRCANPCETVTCPLGTRCNASTARCEPDRCFGVGCPEGTLCAEGRCVRPPRPDAGVDSGFDGGIDERPVVDSGRPRADSGRAAMDTGPLLTDGEGPGDCGCAVPGRGRTILGLPLAALAALLGARRRRR
ncbi:MAG: putative metal-binding motif-containing protein [Deltaproteobacteria bacterium]|nr:putative metal-binding motif-containing protein [Deltaproteobacteria bacterium]